MVAPGVRASDRAGALAGIGRQPPTGGLPFDSMHFAGGCENLMHPFDGADQNADVLIAQVRIALLDDAMRDAIHRAGSRIAMTAEQVVDLLSRFVVDCAQMRILAAFRPGICIL
jgi:hypothetical protein